MHSLTKRTGRLASAIAVVAATVGILTFGAEPAGAAPCNPPSRGCSHNGNRTGTGYSGVAALMTATGGRGSSTSVACTLQGSEAGMDEGAPPVQGHYEVHSYPNGDGTYMVFLDCIENGHTGIPGPGVFLWDVLQIWDNVAALQPNELVEEALAHMPVGSPDIQTSPGGGDPSLVGIDTWLMIDEGSWGRGERTDSQGPVSVTVWAEPNSNGEVLWDTGDGIETCIGSGQPGGSCTHTYQRSSADQDGHEYAITASVSYTGGYSVSLFGQVVGGSSNLGNITRTSEPYYLPVDEAQALNSGG